MATYAVPATLFPGAVAPASWSEFIGRVGAAGGMTAVLTSTRTEMSGYGTTVLLLEFDVALDGADQAIVDGLAAAAPGIELLGEVEERTFTLSPAHAANVHGQAWTPGYAIAITNIKVTAGSDAVYQTPGTDGEFVVKGGSGYPANVAGMTTIDTLVLPSGTTVDDNPQSTPFAIAAGEYVVPYISVLADPVTEPTYTITIQFYRT